MARCGWWSGKGSSLGCFHLGASCLLEPPDAGGGHLGGTLGQKDDVQLDNVQRVPACQPVPGPVQPDASAARVPQTHPTVCNTDSIRPHQLPQVSFTCAIH